MPVLLEVINEYDTVRTLTESVIDSSSPFGHKIVKSTDIDLPAGFKWLDENKELLKGVWEDDDLNSDVLYVRTTEKIVTLAEVKVSNATNFEQSAISEIKKISELDDDIAEQKQVIKDKLAVKLTENVSATTIQSAESLSW